MLYLPALGLLLILAECFGCSNDVIVEPGHDVNVTSPGYSPGGLYPVNVHCMWTIQAPAGQGLRLEWRVFDVEPNTFCSWDYVILRDGSCEGKTSANRLCGSSLPSLVASSVSVICLEFHSDSVIPRNGFVLQVSSLQASPSSPKTDATSPQPSSAATAGTLQGPESSSASGNTPTFGPGLSTSSMAISTYVYTHTTSTLETVPAALDQKSFYTGAPVSTVSGDISAPGDESKAPVATAKLPYASQAASSSVSSPVLSTSTSPAAETSITTSTGGNYQTTIKFGTSEYPVKSFTTATSTFTSSSTIQSIFTTTATATATTTPSDSEPTAVPCQQPPLVVSEPTVLTSPEFGKGLYPTSTQCGWLLMPHGKEMKVTFTAFDLEYHPSCSFDFLRLHSGPEATSPVVTSLCGSGLPFDLVISSASYLHFSSDVIVPRSGFRAVVTEGTSTLKTTTANTPVSIAQSTSQYSDDVASAGNSFPITSPTVASSSQAMTSQTSPQTTENFVTTVAETSAHFKQNSSATSTTISTQGELSTTTHITSPSTLETMTSPHAKSVTTTAPPVEEMEMCKGNNFVTVEGVIVLLSPGYKAGAYPVNVQCSIVVQGPVGKRLFLHFTDFELEPRHEGSCLWDYVQVHDSQAKISLPIISFCGASAPNVTSSANYVTVSFMSDAIIPKRGFRLEVISVSQNDSDHTTPSTSSPSTSSPPTSTSQMTSSITSAPSPSPSTTTSPTSTAVASTPFPSASTLPVTQSNVTPVTGDNFTHHTYAMCSLSSVGCDRNITVTSPGYGGASLYPVNVQCSLLITSPANKHLRLVAVEFEVEQHPQCLWDSLEVYDGSSQLAPVLVKACGGHVTLNVTSSGSNLFLVFISDYIVPKKGFALAITAADQEGFTSTPSAASTTTPTPGLFSSTSLSAIKATTTSVPPPTLPPTTPSTSSTTTSTTPTPITTASTTTTATSSATTAPTTPATTSSLTSTLISLLTTSLSFKATTATAAKPSPCLGVPAVLTNKSGQIASPGFLDGLPYPNEVECEWIITGGENQVVTLTFEAFDLEKHAYCGWDSLEVRDGSSSSSPLLARLCGSLLPPNLTSSQRSLCLRLSTDRIVSRSGFFAKYSLVDLIPVGPTCAPNHVACSTGSCIPLEWQCDGEVDCSDGSDEQKCGQCGEEEWRCQDGSCLPRFQLCDGTVQCPDSEDEYSCASLETETNRLLIMRNGAWFPVCADSWKQDLADDACVAAGCKSSLSQSAMATGDQSFAILQNPVATDAALLPSTAQISSQCESGQAVILNCELKECGQRPSSLPQAYVVGGGRAVRGQWPWAAAIFSGDKLICGGTLVSKNWVVTAGHCMENLVNSPQTTSVVVGFVSVKAPDVEKVKVTEILLHPDHNFIYSGDVALLRLQRPLDVSDRVRPLCLPTRLHSWASTLPCYVAGWGVTDPAVLEYLSSNQQGSLPAQYGDVMSDYLHQAKVRLWPQSKCKAAYPGKVEDFMMCAGYQYGGRDSCKGDSGSPLMCLTSPDRWELVGVTSWGEGCGQAGKPGVYTRVDHYLDWTSHVMASQEPDVDCDFENADMCGYQDNSTGLLLWTRREGGLAFPPRPWRDSTFMNESGHYLYVHIPYEGKGMTSELLTPVMTSHGDACLSLSVTFYGETDAKLELHEERPLGRWRPLLLLLPVSGDWHRARVQLSSDVTRVKIVVKAGYITNTGVGIDDVRLSSGRCAETSKASCDFDDGTLCYYQQAQDDTSDWSIKVIPLQDSLARAISNGTAGGHFLETDGSGQLPGDTTRLLSPWVNSTIPLCLSFAFRIRPAGAFSLSVCRLMDTGHGQTILDCSLWTRSSSPGEEWTSATALIPQLVTPLRIGFQSKRGYLTGSVALDDVKAQYGNCPDR